MQMSFMISALTTVQMKGKMESSPKMTIFDKKFHLKTKQNLKQKQNKFEWKTSVLHEDEDEEHEECKGTCLVNMKCWCSLIP